MSASDDALPDTKAIGHDQYVIIERPDVPVIWLDTHAVSLIAEALRREQPSAQDEGLRELYGRLVRMRQAGNVLLFESDQLWEIDVRPDLVDGCARVLSALSLGVRTSYLHVERQQLAIGMSAFLGGATEAAIPWRTAFEDDPFEDHALNGFVVRVDLQPHAAEVARRKASYRDIAASWEVLRLQNIAAGQRQAERLPGQVKLEVLGAAAAVIHTAEVAVARIRAGDNVTAEDSAVLTELVAEPLALWKRLGGETLIEMVDFYQSAYYANLPLIDIESRLHAWRITGNEPIKSGDVMDIHHISAFMPYCSHMVLDRSMINAVRQLGLDERYDTVVLPLSELGGQFDHMAAAD